MKSAFLVSKGLLCLYDKQNNTWLLVDMEFLFSCSTRHLAIELNARREIPYLRAPMYYSLLMKCLFLSAHEDLYIAVTANACGKRNEIRPCKHSQTNH